MKKKNLLFSILLVSILICIIVLIKLNFDSHSVYYFHNSISHTSKNAEYSNLFKNFNRGGLPEKYRDLDLENRIYLPNENGFIVNFINPPSLQIKDKEYYFNSYNKVDKYETVNENGEIVELDSRKLNEVEKKYVEKIWNQTIDDIIDYQSDPKPNLQGLYNLIN